jgi:sugar transferase (PEP-CTERM/EpsH1 system associated)
MRTYQILLGLSQRHQVSLLTFASAAEASRVEVLRAICHQVYTVIAPQAQDARRLSQLASLLTPAPYQFSRLRSREMQTMLDRVVSEGRFDVVQLETSLMSDFDVRTDGLYVVNEHNIEYELLYRFYRQERSVPRKLFNWLEYVKLRRAEHRAWQRADLCVLTSDREQELLRRALPEKPTCVVPNGVDVEYFRPTGADPDPNRIVFTGLMRYRPNADAAVYFVDEILPRIRRVRPEVTLFIVGAGAPDEVTRLAGPNVIVTDAVPDVRPYVEQAGAVVVPLRIGSGTRLKILEGLAMGKAVVTTTLGCEGLDARDGEHLLVADAPDAFAAGVLRVLDDRALAGRLGTSGRALVEAEYSWASAVQRLEASLVSASGPIAAPVASPPRVAAARA